MTYEEVVDERVKDLYEQGLGEEIVQYLVDRGVPRWRADEMYAHIWMNVRPMQSTVEQLRAAAALTTPVSQY